MKELWSNRLIYTDKLKVCLFVGRAKASKPVSRFFFIISSINGLQISIGT